MYDMYPWDKTAGRRADHGVKDRHSRKRRRALALAGTAMANTAEPAGSATQATPATQSTQAVHAVQVALDRRDNGGDAVSAPTRQ